MVSTAFSGYILGSVFLTAIGLTSLVTEFTFGSSTHNDNQRKEYGGARQGDSYSNLRSKDSLEATAQFLSDLNFQLRQMKNSLARATWNFQINGSVENKDKLANITEQYNDWYVLQKEEALIYRTNPDLFGDMARQLDMFSLSAVAKSDEMRRRQTNLENTMETLYNIEVEKLSSNKTTTGHHQINLLTVMATSRDPNRLKRVWLDWRNAIGSPIRSIYREYVDVLNFAANDNGFSDYSAYWKQSLFPETPDLYRIVNIVYCLHLLTLPGFSDYWKQSMFPETPDLYRIVNIVYCLHLLTCPGFSDYSAYWKQSLFPETPDLYRIVNIVYCLHLLALPGFSDYSAYWKQSLFPETPDLYRIVNIVYCLHLLTLPGFSDYWKQSMFPETPDLYRIVNIVYCLHLLTLPGFSDYWKQSMFFETPDLYRIVNIVYCLHLLTLPGFSDYSAYWKQSLFPETPDLDRMLDSLWDKVRPLYLQLHAYVRHRLTLRYGRGVVGTDGTIPAHLLGDMWAQHWNHISDILVPYPEVDDTLTIDAELKKRFTTIDMVRLAENFYTSLGFPEMTRQFWRKSHFVKRLEEREGSSACQASAFDLYDAGDYRMKMCAKVSISDLKTIHHEMGHIEYFMAYSNQPTIYRAPPSAAFHESVGDIAQLSLLSENRMQAFGLTPNRSSRVGGNSRWKSKKKRSLNKLMQMALDKLAFLPFSLIVDRWRWQVFQGNITPNSYNRKWWDFRRQYQGIRPPVPRSEQDFDPGAKYHIPAHMPFVSYFVAYIQEFQMYRALCDVSGHSGMLHECDLYGSQEAGQRLRNMLKAGSSRPWQEQLKSLTGSDSVTADAILEYFRPLRFWLERYNIYHDQTIGWDAEIKLDVK
ncbi:hypothetical protein RRG08_008521 [Elysia crispata]|uniref:Angiotensin-converting enzyme n=1 Tax=Elysia crispata TaxID=231223 RepID=A0AAE1AC23_9GAST|nr:hypothetical protein RRG08_008521 [Elysia crispata]